MASHTTSTALAKRPSAEETALMPPPPPPKRIKRPPKVLDEDTYTSALSHIIARDFFPGLLESESQQDYLDALDAGDEEWIEEAEKKVREVMSTPRYGRGRRGVTMTPLHNLMAETPRGYADDTPTGVSPASATPSHRGQTPRLSRILNKGNKEDVDLSLGLTDFQAKYTSEDNESFNKVLDKQNIKRAENYRWMWNGNKIPSARQIAEAAREQKLLRAAQQTPTNHDRESTSQALVQRPSQNLDDRPATFTAKVPSNPRNNLMFHASDDIATTHPHLTTVADAAQARSKAPPKTLSYASTRLQTTLAAEDDEDDTSSVAESASLSAIDAAIAGHPRHRSSSTVALSEATGGDETPHVNGYRFVDAEPTASELGIPPSPGPQKHEAKADPEKRKRRADLLASMLDSTAEPSSDGAARGSTGANPFTIHESSKRESLHHRMVDKQLASKRSSSGAAASGRTPAAARGAPTPTPRFTSFTPRHADGGDNDAGSAVERGNLTPAAQRLYERVGRATPARVGGGGAFDFAKAAGRAGEGGAGSGAGRRRRDSGLVTPLGIKRQP